MRSLVLMVLLTAGCAIEINPALQMPPVLGEPLPLTVGVYYGDDLRNRQVSTPVESHLVIFMGRAHVSIFGHLFSEIFVNTIPVKNKFKLPEDGEGLEAVVEPRIVDLTYDIVDDGGFDLKVGVDIRYAITLYSFSGEQLSLWNVAGEGHSEGGYGWSALGEAIESAMRDAAARLVVAIYKDTAMRRCLEGLATETRAAGKLKTCFETLAPRSALS